MKETPITFQEKTPQEKGFEAHFNTYVQQHIKSLEQKRLNALKKLRSRSLLAITLGIASLFFVFLSCLNVRSLADLPQGVSATSLYWLIAMVELTILYLLARYALTPLFSYREHVRSDTGTTISLKDTIYSELLKFFGDFTFRHSGGVSLADMQPSQILPEYDDCLCEDRIVGTYDNTTVDISEVTLIRHILSKRVAVFKGLAVVLDFSNPDKILRAPFSGNTVVIQDERKELKGLKEKYAGLSRMMLPSPELEATFEAYTSNPQEAQRVVTKEFLEHLLALSNQLTKVEKQETHIDDAFLKGLQSFGNWAINIHPVGIFSRLVAFLIRLVVPRSAFAFKEAHDNVFAVFSLDELKDFSKDVAVLDGLLAINQSVQCSCYNDKVLITIPCKHDLFEPNPIFEPALNEEDIHLLFLLIHTVVEITKRINASVEAKG